MRHRVFVGPSLSHSDGAHLLDADFFPPVRRGSLDSCEPGQVAAIIDGELPPGAPLPEHEIAAALDRGVALYGAASVGAYRAWEFADQGMRGVGWVYDQYAARKLSSPDEIAVIYDPLSLQSLSIPLINVRCWLDGLAAELRIRHPETSDMMEELRELKVFERDLGTIKKCLHRLLRRNSLQRELEVLSSFPDVKRKDAQALLQLLSSVSNT